MRNWLEREVIILICYLFVTKYILIKVLAEDLCKLQKHIHISQSKILVNGISLKKKSFFLTHFTTICKLLVNRWYWKLQTVLIQVLLINMCWDYWACLLETWLTCWWYRIQLMSSSGSHPWILMCTVLRLDSTAVSVSWKLNSAFFYADTGYSAHSLLYNLQYSLLICESMCAIFSGGNSIIS